MNEEIFSYLTNSMVDTQPEEQENAEETRLQNAVQQGWERTTGEKADRIERI